MKNKKNRRKSLDENGNMLTNSKELEKDGTIIDVVNGKTPENAKTDEEDVSHKSTNALLSVSSSSTFVCMEAVKDDLFQPR